MNTWALFGQAAAKSAFRLLTASFKKTGIFFSVTKTTWSDLWILPKTLRVCGILPVDRCPQAKCIVVIYQATETPGLHSSSRDNAAELRIWTLVATLMVKGNNNILSILLLKLNFRAEKWNYKSKRHSVSSLSCTFKSNQANSQSPAAWNLTIMILAAIWHQLVTNNCHLVRNF